MTKGGITTKQFTQDWRCYQGASKHMLRFFACYPDITVDQMSEPSHRAWIACHEALNEFTDEDRDTVIRYFSAGWDTSKQKPKQQNGIDQNTAAIVSRAIRAVAIRSGLADE